MRASGACASTAPASPASAKMPPNKRLIGLSIKKKRLRLSTQPL